MNLPMIQNRLGLIKHSIRSALDMVTDSKGKFSAIQDVGIDKKLVEDITSRGGNVVIQQFMAVKIEHINALWEAVRVVDQCLYQLDQEKKSSDLSGEKYLDKYIDYLINRPYNVIGLSEFTAEVKKHYIRKRFDECNGDRTEMAKKLNTSRQEVGNLLRRYGVDDELS